MCIRDRSWDAAASFQKPCFAVATRKRSFRFLADGAADAERWLDALGRAVVAVARDVAPAGAARAVGWTHVRGSAASEEKSPGEGTPGRGDLRTQVLVRGTLWSAAFLGDRSALTSILAAAPDVDARDGDGLCQKQNIHDTFNMVDGGRI